jgi:indolepyruvate ferredoxin oxidoreductase alpha subunit
MTGHQPHPGTGRMVTGEPTMHVSLEAVAKALGAGLVKTVDPYNLDEAVQCFNQAKEFPGLSVVIARQACVINARRSGGKKKTFQVSEDCVGCKVCQDFGCTAVEFVEEKAKINNLCTGCGVCAQLCPSSCILEVGK